MLIVGGCAAQPEEGEVCAMSQQDRQDGSSSGHTAPRTKNTARYTGDMHVPMPEGIIMQSVSLPDPPSAKVVAPRCSPLFFCANVAVGYCVARSRVLPWL